MLADRSGGGPPGHPQQTARARGPAGARRAAFVPRAVSSGDSHDAAGPDCLSRRFQAFLFSLPLLAAAGSVSGNLPISPFAAYNC
ncbi:conserved protein of unknown function (plasmid) [Cupriavidus taiwanensis]|uniref:Uncharacterized protein n=1 Tax=Cupriavidus taiwanensis TaxID=164546 RepID=A0A375IIW1_9BURK|nr:conserved protein of unknown function [Cupriavidus taiwanensis]